MAFFGFLQGESSKNNVGIILGLFAGYLDPNNPKSLNVWKTKKAIEGPNLTPKAQSVGTICYLWVICILFVDHLRII